MNSTESSLQRLFRAAARAPQPLPSEAPFWMECQILRAWRHLPAREVPSFPVALVRRAFVCACVILAISGGLAFRALRESPPNELLIVDSAIQLTLMQ